MIGSPYNYKSKPEVLLIYGSNSYPNLIDLANPPENFYYNLYMKDPKGSYNFGFISLVEDINGDGRNELVFSDPIYVYLFLCFNSLLA